MGTDEVGTLNALKDHRRERIDPTIARHNGRVFKTTGDGLLAPNDYGALRDKSGVLRAQGDLDGAAVVIRKLIEMNPLVSYRYNDLARLIHDPKRRLLEWCGTRELSSVTVAGWTACLAR